MIRLDSVGVYRSHGFATTRHCTLSSSTVGRGTGQKPEEGPGKVEGGENLWNSLDGHNCRRAFLQKKINLFGNKFH
jgi:hypothetical protein